MNRLLELPVNKDGQDFVIGDIHGKYEQLMLGLDRVHFNFSTDRLISVGDLIDRGPASMSCLDLINKPWFYTVMGNHEYMMYDALTFKRSMYVGTNNPLWFWITNGGEWYYTLDDDKISILKDKYCPYILNDMPIGIDLVAKNGKRVAITHAGLPKAWTWTQFRKHISSIDNIHDTVVQNALWTRSRIQTTSRIDDILGTDLLINGHTPSKGKVWRGNNVFIDLGYHNPYQLVPINVIDLLEEK